MLRVLFRKRLLSWYLYYIQNTLNYQLIFSISQCARKLREKNGLGGASTPIKNLHEIHPLTDDIKGSLSKIFGNDKFNLDDYIDNFDFLAKIVGQTDTAFISFLETTQKSGTLYKTSGEAIAGFQAYLKSTSNALSHTSIKTKALSASMQLLSSIGWTALITGITWAFGEGIKAISNYIHRVELAQQVMKELNSEFNETQQRISSHKQLVNEVAKSFDELSKGVDTASNKNIDLSTEEYEK